MMQYLKKFICTALSLSMISAGAVIPASAAENTPPSAPSGLLTNELENPMNTEDITFGWIVNDGDFNEIQTAYEIVVTDGVTGETAWDSGKVMSDEQSNVAYSGDALKEGRPYTWKVKTWDKDGEESPYSKEAPFSTGISDENWDAYWISDGTGGADAKIGKYNHYWYTRGTKELSGEKTVAKAMGYFAAEQDYDLYINGIEIGRGQSFDYASETRYQGWDVTDAVKRGGSTLTAGALVRTYGPGQGRAAADAGFIGRINIYYTDGTSDTMVTDSDWKISKSVPLSGTTQRNGEGDFVEQYNAQAALDDFTESSFNDSSWTAASVLGKNTTEAITAMYPELFKQTSDIVYPVSIEVLPDGTTVADFGKVIPARPSVAFKNGKAGKQVTLQGGYVTKADGSVDKSDKKTQSTNMTWVYTQKDGEQVYDAWDHLAFRYLSIPACGESFTKETIAARIVHTDVPDGRESTIVTSNEMLNEVYEMMKRSALYSIQNSFVDTPTREKGQFLQDSINISEATVASSYERAASKKAIEQFIASADRYWTGDEAGRFNSVYPNGDGKRDIPDFTVNFPYWIWNYYMTTGDKAFLEKVYPYAKNTAEYITKYISSDTGLVTKLGGGDGSPNSYQYGIVDWPEPGRFGYDWKGTKDGARTTVNMISKRAFDVVALMAFELGNTEDKNIYEKRSEEIKTAINEKLLTDDGVYCDGLKSDGKQSSVKSQRSTSYALAFDIAPMDKADKMADYVADMGMKQGPMTSDILVKGLINSGKYAAALKLLTEPNDYGWAKEIKNGYSFTFEAWQSDTTENSQSHGWGATAASDILESFAGVSNLEPGASEIKIMPVFTDLTELDADVWTERGAVGVNYVRDDDSYDIKITVPANVKAHVCLPVIGDGKFVEKNGNALESTVSGDIQIINIGSGTYEFSYDGNITVLPEAVEYDVDMDSVKYDFTGLDSDKFNAEYTGEYEYNECVTLNFGNGSSSISNSGNGMDIYSDDSYIKFTPDKTGIIYINAIVRKGSKLMLGTGGTSGGASLSSDVSTKTEITTDKIEVLEGVEYYIYNPTQTATSVKSIEYLYPREEINGIKGRDNSAEKLYTYEIGNASICAEAGESYSDISKYADLTVSLGTDDSMSASTGINFSNTSVGEDNSLNDTKRYILVKPKTDGTFSMDIAFESATSKNNNRVYYKDFENGETDLSQCTKSAGTAIGSDMGTAPAVKTLDMKAGHAYVLYTYQRPSYITAMSFAYKSEPEESIKPTATPTSTPSIAKGIIIKNKTVKDGSVDYSLDINGIDSGEIIAVSYNGDGTLYSFNSKEMSKGEDISVNVKDENSKVKLMVWDSLKGMQPLCAAVSDTVGSEGTASTAAPILPVPGGDSSIILDRKTYPLVVGNASKTDFSDWETRGSSFTLNVEVNSDTYSKSDITWKVEDEDIAYISSSGDGKATVRGKRTGVTSVAAMLPNGDTQTCIITVIDNITRATVNELEFNTDKLNLKAGASAELIPIINPKDVFGNGVINNELTWSSSDSDIVSVENGKVLAKGEGNAVITAVSDDTGRKAECTVTVSSDAKTSDITAQNTETVNMETGDIKKLEVSGDTEITWKSDNSNIVNVDENGNVKAYSNSNVPKLEDNKNYNSESDNPVELAEKTVVFDEGKVQYEQGTVNVYATALDGAVKTYKIAVSDKNYEAESVSISEDKINIANGDIKTVAAAALPANMMDKQVVWSSSDNSVAEVKESGRNVYGLCQADIKALSSGRAVITAECDGKKDSCTVTVTDGKVMVSDIEIENFYDIEVDETAELLASVNEDVSNGEIIWVSSDANTVTVSADGEIQGLKEGNATIYAVAADSADNEVIKELRYVRSASEEEIEAAAEVYTSCEINVLESSSYLRNVRIPNEAITDNSVNILWNRSSMLDVNDFDHYTVSYGDVSVDVTTLGYTANNLEADTDYEFTVTAVTEDGDAVEEKTVSAHTKPQSQIVNVLDYGAVGNGKVLDTIAIQNAVNDCPEGGTVYLPAGYVFLSGALFLKSDMTFKVDGILMGSQYDKDYPLMVTRWEGWRKVNQKGDEWANTTESLPDNHYAHSSLINVGTYDEGKPGHTGAYNVKNVVICGEGQINANGLRLAYNEGPNQKTGNGGIPVPMSAAIDQTVRGRGITIHNAQNVYMKDVQVAYAPSWTIHAIYSKNLTFDNLDIISKGDGKTGAADDICVLNGDGIDPDSSVNVNIFNVYFKAGDDAVAVKSGRNKEGNDLDKPVQFLNITDCVSDTSKGGFAVGSENASGVKNVLMQNLKIINPTLSDGIWFKTYWSRGGLSEDVYVKDITSSKKIGFQMTYSTSENNPADTLPEYRYITVENTNCSVEFLGSKDHGTTYVNNVNVKGVKSGKADYCKDFNIWDMDESKWNITHSENMNFIYSDIDTSTRLAVKEGAQYVSAVDNTNHTITAVTGASGEQILSELEPVISSAALDISINAASDVVTVVSQNGEVSVEYTIQYAKVWNFNEYMEEVKTTEIGFKEEYNGLTIAIADNGADSDHDNISQKGVYWRGGAKSGESTRYIEFTPDEDGTLYAVGKCNSSNGRWGISETKVVTDLKADSSSSTSTSETSVYKECKAGTTYYILPKDRPATVSRVFFVPKAE